MRNMNAEQPAEPKYNSHAFDNHGYDGEKPDGIRNSIDVSNRIILQHQYSQLSLSRLRLSRITAYL